MLERLLPQEPFPTSLLNKNALVALKVTGLQVDGDEAPGGEVLLDHIQIPTQLVGVQVPSSYAHWVSPGVCSNGVGYYEVPNARVIYRESGQRSSFGIASMISWRGVWYVVHLGGVVRSSDAGVVDDPSSGSGVSAPSSTC